MTILKLYFMKKQYDFHSKSPTRDVYVWHHFQSTSSTRDAYILAKF